VSSGVYELPFGRGRTYGKQWNKAVDAVLGGWQVGGILALQSGSPFTPGTGRDIANNGRTTRPDRLGLGTVADPTITRWFDGAAFTNPAAFTYGNSGRNILRGPGSQNLDGIVSKSFGLGTESRYLQYRFEAFNVFNHANFATPHLRRRCSAHPPDGAQALLLTLHRSCQTPSADGTKRPLAA
jgi:hypothetical protein